MTAIIKDKISAGEIMALLDAGPVIVHCMSADDYSAVNAVRSTMLKDLAHAPAYCYRRHHDPTFVREPEQRHFAIGRAVHCLVLEPEAFGAQFYLLPEDLEGRSKAAIDARAELESANAGKTMIKQSELPELRAIADSALRSPRIDKLLARGVFEVSIFWRDTETGLPCKARPDYMIEPCGDFPDGLLFDLKTTADASAYGFRKACGNYDYPMQMAHYARGMSAAFGTGTPAIVFCAVEKSDPYLPATFLASQQFMERGEARRQSLMSALSVCIDTGDWPGYSNDIQPLDAPAWYGRDSQPQEF